MSSFVDAVKVCVVQKPFNWKDRASRSEFWWCMLFVFLANIVIGILGLIPVLGAIIGFVGGIALGWLNTIVAIRRLHDLNKRGYWLIAVYVPLIIGTVLSVVGMEEYEEGLIYAGSALCFIGAAFYIYLIVIFCLRGTVGPNRFGPDPLNGVPGAFPQAAQNFAPNMQQQQPAQFFGQNQGFNPNQQGFNPNQQGFDPNQQAMPNTAAAPAPAQAVAPEAAPAQDVAPQTAQDAAVEAVPAQETKEEAVEQKESKQKLLKRCKRLRRAIGLGAIFILLKANQSYSSYFPRMQLAYCEPAIFFGAAQK